MLNIIVYCVFAFYCSTVLISEQSWEIGDGFEILCLLVTAVLVFLPTGATSELGPTEFRTHRYGEIMEKASCAIDLMHCRLAYMRIYWLLKTSFLISGMHYIFPCRTLINFGKKLWGRGDFIDLSKNKTPLLR